MNDVQLDQYGDFTKDWKLVTVRYRKDSGEMRFTYANDKAFEALTKKTPYPDGAVFAKVGLKTGADPAFISSVVPQTNRRFQFMVRNKEKYAQTDGWGYALFKSDGGLFPEDPHAQTVACHACHRLVADRNFVFSQYLNLSPFQKFEEAKHSEILSDRLSYKKVPAKTLPPNLTRHLPEKEKYIFLVTGEITEKPFYGTTDEIQPSLLAKSKQLGTAVGFVSADQKHSVIVFPSQEEMPCGEKEKPFVIVVRTSKKSCQ